MLTKYVFKMVVLSKIVYSVQQMDLVNKYVLYVIRTFYEILMDNVKNVTKYKIVVNYVTLLIITNVIVVIKVTI